MRVLIVLQLGSLYLWRDTTKYEQIYTHVRAQDNHSWFSVRQLVWCGRERY
jgi:hypothetical protein